MKQKFLICCIGLMLTSTTACAETLRAHFEVNLKEGDNVKTIRTSADVVTGQPLEYNLGEYRLSLVIDRTSHDDYVLAVYLATTNSPLFHQSFPGRLVRADNGPLEFSMEQRGILVSGVMALSSVE